jgi:hypothetical protein
MTGYEEYNFPAFNDRATYLEGLGWAVHSPAASFNGRVDLDYKLYMRAAIMLLLQSDAIALMVGWEWSKGARMEALIAQRLGVDFYCAKTGRELDVAELDLGDINVGYRNPHASNVDLIDSLVPLAQELAEGNVRGITVTDLRKEGLRRDILSGDETPSQLSALGHVMRRADLIHFNTTRRSDLDVTHGVRQTVWFQDLSSAQSRN